MVELFKEDRGNFYFIVEVHAVHEELIPNARRDNFNENTVRNELEARLKYYFSGIHQLYHNANDAKSAYKKDIELRQKEVRYEQKNGKFVNDKERENIEREFCIVY